MAVIACLTLASLLTQVSHYVWGWDLKETVDLGKEGNIPTWYASQSLLLCSILLMMITQAKLKPRARYINYWRTLSLIFLYMSIDELFGLHERLIKPLRHGLGTSDILYYAWVIPFGLLVLIFGLAYLKFLKHLPRKTKYLFLLAFTLYVGGALGVELFEGHQADLYGEENMIYALATTLEEFLEMAGVVVFIYGLMTYISSYMQGIQINIGVKEPESKTQLLGSAARKHGPAL